VNAGPQVVAHDATTARVLELFERHRATPGAPYDPARFLDHLLAEPRKPRAVHDSFRGKWRFHAFLDDVQMEFAVCFNNKDRDSDPSLERFVARLEELRASRRSTLASLRYQQALPFGWAPVVVVNLFGFAAASVAFALWRPLAIAVVAAVLLADAWVARWWWRQRAYLERLAARLEAER
jgi:hypothetical protein